MGRAADEPGFDPLDVTPSRNPLRPSTRSVKSRAWAHYVNTVAASPLVGHRTRQRIYQRFGLDVQTDAVFPRCYFHSANLHVASEALLNHGVHIENTARVEIGARTALGIHTTVLTSNHELGTSHMRAGRWFQEPVTIGAGCWLGAKTLVLPGTVIEDGCLIAAGSVVRGLCEANGLYAGVPARRIRNLGP